MIALRARDNGQLLAAVIGPRSVQCTPDPQRALSFTTKDEARAFLREHGLVAYFETIARPVGNATEGKRRRGAALHHV